MPTTPGEACPRVAGSRGGSGGRQKDGAADYNCRRAGRGGSDAPMAWSPLPIRSLPLGRRRTTNSSVVFLTGRSEDAEALRRPRLEPARYFLCLLQGDDCGLYGWLSAIHTSCRPLLLIWERALFWLRRRTPHQAIFRPSWNRGQYRGSCWPWRCPGPCPDGGTHCSSSSGHSTCSRAGHFWGSRRAATRSRALRPPWWKICCPIITRRAGYWRLSPSGVWSYGRTHSEFRRGRWRRARYSTKHTLVAVPRGGRGSQSVRKSKVTDSTLGCSSVTYAWTTDMGSFAIRGWSNRKLLKRCT